MIIPLIGLMAGGMLLVFFTHLTHRLEGEEIFPFWMWSLAVLKMGLIGLAFFLPIASDNPMAFGAIMSLATAVFGLAGIIKTLPPL